VQVRVGKVSSPTANVSQILTKVSESEKVCFFWCISTRYVVSHTVLKVGFLFIGLCGPSI
jgi:hypothetical protein